MFYSKSTGGFYPEEMRSEYEKKGTWPIDAIEITEETRRDMLAGEGAGRVIVADDTGSPVLVDPAEPTQAQLWSARQTLALLALSESDRTVLRCVENSIAVPAAWSVYRRALRAIVSTATGDPGQDLPTRPGYPAGT